ncbi:MAG: helix-turn-helix domain-containing protein [Chthoniobacterales bacterium]
MEGLGEKFQKARLARNLTLEEAARMTKIRPAKLAELEAEDFSKFPSLAYAKGFLLIYGKFLNVDVTPYLEAFETSDQVTVDGYSYLQDNPAPPPRRVEVVPRRPAAAGGTSSLMKLVLGFVVLLVGFSLLKFMMTLRRITPAERDQQALAAASATAAPVPQTIVAPRALPADNTPAPTAVAIAPTPVPAVATSPPVMTPEPTAVAQALPAEEAEPEVRRAEPVHPEDLTKAKAAMAAMSPSASPTTNRFDIRPLKKTFVRVTLDTEAGRSSFERWLDVSAPVQLRGKHIAVKVLDPADIEIRKNGKIVARGDSDVRLE